MSRTRAFACATVLFAAVLGACGSTHTLRLPAGVRSGAIARHPALEAGSGSTAVVMIHGASTHMDQWLPLMPAIARAGYRAVAIELGRDRAAAVAAAIADVRTAGATRVVLFGSSLGAQDALEAAAATGRATDIVAVVTFSAVTVHTAPAPVLAVASQHDPNADTVAIGAQIVRGSGRNSRTIVVPGSVHGVDLVRQHGDVIAQVVAWLHATIG